MSFSIICGVCCNVFDSVLFYELSKLKSEVNHDFNLLLNSLEKQ